MIPSLKITLGSLLIYHLIKQPYLVNGFYVKYHANGYLAHYKAQLFAHGFSQKPNIDYDETFFSIIRIISLQVLIASTTIYDLQIHQKDVKTIFLHGVLIEEIYMNQPLVLKILELNIKYVNCCDQDTI
jgi:hypothetical protein